MLVAIVVVWRAGNRVGTSPIRFAYQNRAGSALCIIAVEKELFNRQGVAVEAARFNSGPACSEALYSGAADIATISLSPSPRIVCRTRPAPPGSHSGADG